MLAFPTIHLAKTMPSSAAENAIMTIGEVADYLKVTELRERMQARMAQAKIELTQLQTAAVGQAREAAKATDHFVHESPWTAVGIAAGVGLIAGLLIGRR
jgi:ElaB/YqjD/DUF883 family membrane-anchored ribosome-binding protein